MSDTKKIKVEFHVDLQAVLKTEIGAGRTVAIVSYDPDGETYFVCTSAPDDEILAIFAAAPEAVERHETRETMPPVEETEAEKAE